MVKQSYQVMPDLSADEYQALKDDIRQHGVLVPVEKDESGHIPDGHHRDRAWNELRTEGLTLPPYPVLIRAGLSEDEKILHAQTVNVVRRHLSKEEHRTLWSDWRNRWRMSYRRIADMSGVSEPTVLRALTSTDTNVSVAQPATIIGKDGKERAAKAPRAKSLKTVITDNKSQQSVIEGIAKVGADALPDKVVPEKRAARIIREAESEQEREAITG